MTLIVITTRNACLYSPNSCCVKVRASTSGSANENTYPMNRAAISQKACVVRVGFFSCAGPAAFTFTAVSRSHSAKCLPEWRPVVVRQSFLRTIHWACEGSPAPAENRSAPDRHDLPGRLCLGSYAGYRSSTEAVEWGSRPRWLRVWGG